MRDTRAVDTVLRVAVYLRISDDPEGLEAGVDRQRADCLALVERLKLGVVVKIYMDDDIGASTRSRKHRPGYAQMIADAHAGRIDVIVAYTSSRLTRRPREHEDLIELSEKFGVRFAYDKSPTFDLNTADGRQVARTLAAADAGEAERTGERITRAKKEQALSGERSGGSRPTGYERGGMVVRQREADLIADAIDAVTSSKGRALYSIAAAWDTAMPPTGWTARAVDRLAKKDPAMAASDAETALIVEARRRLDRGDKPRQIMHDWVDNAVPVPGARWTPGTVKHVLTNPRNAGLIIRNDAEIPARWPKIVEPDQWRAVCAVLSNPARRTTAGAVSRRWVGSGLYRCGQPGCPGVMRSATQRQRGDLLYLYRCSVANHLSINAHLIDEKVTAMVEGLLSRDRASLIRRAPGVDVDGLRREAEALRARKAAGAAAFAAGSIDAEEWGLAGREIKRRLLDVESQLAAVVGGSVLAGVADVDDPVAAWRGITDVGIRRAIIAELIDVTVLPVQAVCDGTGDRRTRALRRVQIRPAVTEPPAPMDVNPLAA